VTIYRLPSTEIYVMAEIRKMFGHLYIIVCCKDDRYDDRYGESLAPLLKNYNSHTFV